MVYARGCYPKECFEQCKVPGHIFENEETLKNSNSYTSRSYFYYRCKHKAVEYYITELLEDPLIQGISQVWSVEDTSKCPYLGIRRARIRTAPNEGVTLEFENVVPCCFVSSKVLTFNIDHIRNRAASRKKQGYLTNSCLTESPMCMRDSLIGLLERTIACQYDPRLNSSHSNVSQRKIIQEPRFSNPSMPAFELLLDLAVYSLPTNGTIEEGEKGIPDKGGSNIVMQGSSWIAIPEISYGTENVVPDHRKILHGPYSVHSRALRSDQVPSSEHSSEKNTSEVHDKSESPTPSSCAIVPIWNDHLLKCFILTEPYADRITDVKTS